MPSEKSSQRAASSQPAEPAPQDLPPSYENVVPAISTPSNIPPSIRIPSQNPLDAIYRLGLVALAKYGVSQGKWSKDLASITTTKPELSETEYELVRFIHEQAALPPKPLMLIHGEHSRGGENVIDFEILINLTSLLDITGTSAQSRTHVKPFDDSSSPRSSRNSNRTPLEQWIKKFCEEKVENKSFTLHRQVTNLPGQILEGMVRTLVASTKYRGKLTVSFPVQYTDVIVSRQGGNWFTNMLRLSPTKKYEVVEAVWDVAASSGAERSSASANANDHSARERNGRAGLIAQEWWREWQYAIYNGVLTGRKGWVTVEDWMEAKMGVRVTERNRDWGVDWEG
ncbi:hypothetical protein EDD37DRAFT_606107 [Exophiala viscosa]|uniref:Uncharacterized protein n=1 Tax=Exophiala viscosa TaxID=2486360 RepID=A0AAN6IHZ5_9EURO|nr:hypothetical protein EDD36DRAFT_23213 [Exophiala viscosa]KAI1627285.1 hypothetical protein EDD37DRAFT_606107 [Exophiala viscosa]